MRHGRISLFLELSENHQGKGERPWFCSSTLDRSKRVVESARTTKTSPQKTCSTICSSLALLVGSKSSAGVRSGKSFDVELVSGCQGHVAFAHSTSDAPERSSLEIHRRNCQRIYSRAVPDTNGGYRTVLIDTAPENHLRQNGSLCRYQSRILGFGQYRGILVASKSNPRSTGDQRKYSNEA